MKIILLVPRVAFVHPFCPSVKTPQSFSDSYILSEIIFVDIFHMFGRHVTGR